MNRKKLFICIEQADNMLKKVFGLSSLMDLYCGQKMPRRTLSGLFVGRSLSKWYLKRSSKALIITSKGRRTKGSSMEWDSVVLLSLAESSLKSSQILIIHAHYVLGIGVRLMEIRRGPPVYSLKMQDI